MNIISMSISDNYIWVPGFESRVHKSHSFGRYCSDNCNPGTFALKQNSGPVDWTRVLFYSLQSRVQFIVYNGQLDVYSLLKVYNARFIVYKGQLAVYTIHRPVSERPRQSVQESVQDRSTGLLVSKANLGTGPKSVGS